MSCVRNARAIVPVSLFVHSIVIPFRVGHTNGLQGGRRCRPLGVRSAFPVRPFARNRNNTLERFRRSRAGRANLRQTRHEGRQPLHRAVAPRFEKDFGSGWLSITRTRGLVQVSSSQEFQRGEKKRRSFAGIWPARHPSRAALLKSRTPIGPKSESRWPKTRRRCKPGRAREMQPRIVRVARAKSLPSSVGKY